MLIKKLLGFERKARLFCDSRASIKSQRNKKGWDLSVRLGYFVTNVLVVALKSNQVGLGFERKARLFCDKITIAITIAILTLGFERKARLFCDIFVPKNGISILVVALGFERKARLFCD